MLLRISGALLVAAAVTLAGYMKSEALYRREIRCRSIRECLIRSSYLIRYRSLTVYELCAELKNSPFSSDLSFINSLPEEHIQGIGFSSLWESALDMQTDMETEERQLLHRLGSELGNSDTEGQLKMLAALAEEASILHERRRTEYETHGRLWRSVGVLAGLMAAVLII